MELIGRSTVHPAVFMTAKASVVLCTLAPFAAMTWPGIAPWTLPWRARAVGWALYLVGGLLIVVASRQLGRDLRVGLPTGSTRLRTSGLFAVSRNPIYASFYAVAVGTSLLAPGPFAWLVSGVALFLHHRIILGEERFLARRFGREWAAYRSRVRRYV
jgi:protein-S-isoprenylcysteine O-methyltransferase Ste14